MITNFLFVIKIRETIVNTQERKKKQRHEIKIKIKITKLKVIYLHKFLSKKK